MNNRVRQWFRACEMLDKHDPPMMVFVKDPESGETHVLLIRESQLEAAKEEYRDRLEVWE